MKRTLILTIVVLACALTLCALSLRSVNATASEALRLQSLTVLAVQEDRPSDAEALMAALAEYWRGQENLMEMLVSHDALHEVSSAIAEAAICLECNDHDDFLRTMSGVQAGLEHLQDEAAVRLANIY